MEKNKKKRSDNWSIEEKALLRQLISQSAHIIENRQNNTSNSLKKAKEWKKITSCFFEITRKPRNENDLKMAWKRVKLSAKANVSAHRQQLSQTGGGEKPPSPSQEDQIIMGIAPYDFCIEKNIYDSDGVQETEREMISNIDATMHVAGQCNSSTLDLVIEPVPGSSFISIEPECLSASTNIVMGSVNTEDIKKKTTRNSTADSSIMESNLNYKKRNLEMLEEMHQYNIKIAQLQITKLELEIEELKKNTK